MLYRDDGAGGSNIYIGGSSDPAHIYNGYPSEWSPSITLLADDLQIDKAWRLKLDTSYETDEENYTFIDTMVHKSSAQTVFGSTRSVNRSTPGHGIYLWKIQFIWNSKYFDDTTFVAHKFEADSSCYVTGLVNKSDGNNGIHFVLFNSSTQELFYFEKSFNNLATISGERIAINIYHAEQTFFASDDFEAVGSLSEVYESYTIGFA